ncbi:DJ-1 family glyoxalase III [Fibrobacterota bacterium]
MKKVILLLAQGFEEMETVIPLDILRRGGVTVETAAIGPDRAVEGCHQIKLLAEKTLAECHAGEYDMVIVPGGQPGVDNLKADPRVLELLMAFIDGDKWVAAICAGPQVLALAGILSGTCITSYPSVKPDLVPHIKTYSEDRVVVDGRIITSRGAGCAEAFGFTLLEILTDRGAAQRVKEQILSSVSW